MVDFSAMTKWPNVPACYDWLSLDRRGQWRLQGERVTHPGLIDFINRQYTHDDTGRWFVQNGPQRVFVELAATPWVFHLANGPESLLTAHTGQPAGKLGAVYLDDDGNVLLETELGIGLLDDRDLALFFGTCTDIAEHPIDEAVFERLLAGEPVAVLWRGQPVRRCLFSEIEGTFGFTRHPRP